MQACLQATDKHRVALQLTRRIHCQIDLLVHFLSDMVCELRWIETLFAK